MAFHATSCVFGVLRAQKTATRQTNRQQTDRWPIFLFNLTIYKSLELIFLTSSVGSVFACAVHPGWSRLDMFKEGSNFSTPN